MKTPDDDAEFIDAEEVDSTDFMKQQFQKKTQPPEEPKKNAYEEKFRRRQKLKEIQDRIDQIDRERAMENLFILTVLGLHLDEKNQDLIRRLLAVKRPLISSLAALIRF